MSITLLVDVLATVAKRAAATLPKTEAGALPAQVEIFGWGASTLGQLAEAASHDENVDIAATAAVFGIAAAVIGTPLILPALGITATTGLAASLMAEAVVSIGLSGIAGSVMQGVLEQVAEAVDDYNNGDALGLKALAEEYGWPQSVIPVEGFEPILPDWLVSSQGLYGRAMQTYSPLVLDLDGDGVETTKMGYGVGASSVYFDLNNDGFAERTGWVTGGDGLLALDINSNGVIDNQSELFGNSSSYADGFAYLETFDSNTDGKISSADANWSSFRVWVDANEDGVTNSGELKAMTTLGITEISLSSTPLTDTYNNENPVSDTSTFVIGGQTRTVSDVWFRADGADTRYLEDVELDEAVFFLPTLKGFGTLPDLHVAMSSNSDLLDLVSDFAANWDTTKFEDKDALDAEIDEILFTWAGVESVSPTSRGDYVDARELEFLEKLLGRPWEYSGDEPFDLQGPAVSLIYDFVQDKLGALLIAQSGLDSLYDEPPIYSALTSEITGGVLSDTAVAALSSEADNAPDAEEYWISVANVLMNIKNPSEFSGTEIAALDSAIQESLPLSSWEDISSQAMVVLIADATYSATDFSDYIVGTESSGETFTGLAGDDVYYFKKGFGNDTVFDLSGDDTIQFAPGITIDDLRFERTSGLNYLTIYYSPTDSVALSNHFYDLQNNTSYYDEVETIRFADGNTYNLLGYFTFTGTVGDDSVNGTITNDTIVGLAGNDTLYGDTGDDTYIFDVGYGLDTISDFGGTDTIKLGAGITTETISVADEGTTGATIITDSGVDEIDIFNYRASGNYAAIENLEFIDGFKVDLTSYNAWVWGTSSGQTTNGTSGVDTIFGREGDDTINGLAGADAIHGGSGGDTINGGDGNDQIFGGDGNDTLAGDANNDFLNGGVGNDNYYFASGTDTVVDTGGTDKIYLPTSIDISEVFLLRFSDSPEDLRIRVGHSDSSNGAWLGDVIVTDQFAGAATHVETLRIQDGGGYDVSLTSAYVQTLGTGGSDVIYGIGYGASPDDQILDLVGTDDVISSGAGADVVYAGAGNDTVSAGADGDAVFGMQGDDTIAGDGGADYLYGDYDGTEGYGGADTLSGGAGSDWMFGGAGNDTLAGEDDADLIYGQQGADTLYGGGGADYLYGDYDGTEVYTGGNDVVYGGSGADWIEGGDGTDTLYGEAGDDYILGQDGDDYFSGGDGLDSVMGGSGADTFIFKAASAFNNVDVVYDFSTTDGDKLHLADVLQGFDPLTDAITDFVEITTSGSNSILKVDADGGANGFVQIATLLNVTGLTNEATLLSNGNIVAV